MKSQMSLRRAFLVFATVLALLGVLGGGGMILFSTGVNRMAGELGSAVESVRIAEELELELLGHWATEDSVARVSSEGRLRKRLEGAERFVGSPQEGALVARLRGELDRYIEVSHRAGATPQSLTVLQERSRHEFELAFATAREVIETNVEQSRVLVRSAEDWTRVGNLSGSGVILLLLGGLTWLAFFLRRAAFGPAVSIAAAVERYSRGERAARAPERGAAEFRVIANSFNLMASTLERQREHQQAFLAGVAHDLRNPLSALKMASAVISPEKPLPPEERIRQSYARVQRQVHRLERMLFDLLDTARIEAGELQLQLEPCDLAELARVTIDLFEPAAPEHRLSLAAPAALPSVMADPTRIEQVLNNLVSNAIKYSPRGGRVEVVLEAQGEGVVLTVKDEGVGIEADELQSIFEPFRRTSASRASVPGVGLGLFVARRIVEGHGGRLTVESAPGRGSTFQVRLPARPGA